MVEFLKRMHVQVANRSPEASQRWRPNIPMALPRYQFVSAKVALCFPKVHPTSHGAARAMGVSPVLRFDHDMVGRSVEKRQQ